MGRTRASITFDDGPHPQTLELLDVLAAHQVPATFFQCGSYVRQHPDIARAVAARHEIGNHTDTHPRLWLSSPNRIREEVTRAQESIVEATGVVPQLFRSTYGIPGIGMGRALKQHGLTNVLWTVIGNDWKYPAARIAERVISKIKPNGIICLHDGRDVNPHPDIRETIEAVKIIVPALLERGYEFVTASEILWPRKTSHDASLK